MSFLELSAQENSPAELAQQQANTATPRQNNTVKEAPKQQPQRPPKRIRGTPSKKWTRLLEIVLATAMDDFQPTKFMVGAPRQVTPLLVAGMIVSTIFSPEFQRRAKIYQHKPKLRAVVSALRRIFPDVNMDFKPSFSKSEYASIKLLYSDIAGSMTLERDGRARTRCAGFKMNSSMVIDETWVKRVEQCLEEVQNESGIKELIFADTIENTTKNVAKILTDLQPVAPLLTMKRQRAKSPKKAKMNHIAAKTSKRKFSKLETTSSLADLNENQLVEWVKVTIPRLEQQLKLFDGVDGATLLTYLRDEEPHSSLQKDFALSGVFARRLLVEIERTF